MHNSAYSLFMFIFLTILIWIIVMGIFAFDSSQGFHNRHNQHSRSHGGHGGHGGDHSLSSRGGHGEGGHGGGDEDGTGWIVSGVIAWFVLVVALLVDAYICNMLSVHREQELSASNYGRVLSYKNYETSGACCMFLLVIVSSVWILVLYSVMLGSCGEFGICCERPSGNKKCHDVRSGFWAQFVLTIIGTVFAVIAAGCVVREPAKKMDKSGSLKTELDDVPVDAAW